jgi:RHS repeat-associated protein
MVMPGRKYPAAGGVYRYGFNGKEKDGEVVQYDYGFRIYDPRLVRFKSVDPIARSFAWNSPYSYAEGDLIRSVDLDGLEKYVVNRIVDSKGTLLSINIQSFTDENGELRDNETYKGNTKLKKADVYVITRLVKTEQQVGNTQYQDKLTNEQQIVVDQFTEKTKVSKLVEGYKKNEPNANGAQINDVVKEGGLKGLQWKDGNYNEASIELSKSVRLNFQVNSDAPATPTESSKLADVAKILQTFPGSKAILTGNTGTNVGAGGPTGSGPDVVNQRGQILNNQPATTGQIMRARANAAKKMLHDNYGIPNNRMETKTGTNQNNPNNRKVDVKVTGINL